ncbi:unnamed protein product [Sphenostylis stenocarpa]|uniref:Uncharacterized protein n=1 Tax=Sphenostylis stenocarpa TaxID=92480 RepID=A0AA86SKU9_9FABA|nr:unnamed protein product [Sphenostylis stenocarpa]
MLFTDWFFPLIRIGRLYFALIYQKGNSGRYSCRIIFTIQILRTSSCGFLEDYSPCVIFVAQRMDNRWTKQSKYGQEYGDHTSSSKMTSLDFCDIPSCSNVSPVCYTESGDIFGNNRAALLVKWNEDGQVQEQKSHDLPFFQPLVVYRESLFSI